MKLDKYLEALKLSGQVALKARAVVLSDTKGLSRRILSLEEALDAYDNKIIEILNSPEDEEEFEPDDIRCSACKNQICNCQ